VILRVIGRLMPLRAPERDQALGMDIVAHGEQAYTTGDGAILVVSEATRAAEAAMAEPG
jgi:Amt family ammonium transporter